MQMGIVEHGQDLGQRRAKALAAAQVGAQIFKNSTSKVLQMMILEYNQSLVGGAGGDFSPPAAT